jgi:hypothetical protein
MLGQELEGGCDSLLVRQIVGVQKEQPVRRRGADRSVTGSSSVELPHRRPHGHVRMLTRQYGRGEIGLAVDRHDDLLYRMGLTLDAGDRLEHQAG